MLEKWKRIFDPELEQNIRLDMEEEKCTTNNDFKSSLYKQEFVTNWDSFKISKWILINKKKEQGLVLLSFKK
jgi:hypothetical protein